MVSEKGAKQCQRYTYKFLERRRLCGNDGFVSLIIALTTEKNLGRARRSWNLAWLRPIRQVLQDIMVGVTGLEPATSRTPCVRASQLRHTPTVILN